MLCSFKDECKVMKAAITSLLLIFILFPGVDSRAASVFDYFELANGLKVYLYQKPNLPIINISMGFNLGSKDESDETNGLVHLLEHYVLFRGSKSREEDEIVWDVRRHGAYFNAHTSYDVALFEFSLLSKYMDFALENQKDILFNLEITQDKLDEEKEILLQELNQIQDDPLKYATSLVYQNLFKDHPYERPVYGKKEIIQSATAGQLEKFYKTYFVPDNCSMAVVGDFDFKEIKVKIKNVFGPLPKTDFIPAHFEKASLLDKTVQIKKEMDVNNAYLVMGLAGPDYNHPDQYAVDVLVEILGRGLNPMINRLLRGRLNLVYSFSSSYVAMKYGGAILFFFTLDPKNMAVTKRKILDFLKQAKTLNYSRKDYAGESRLTAYDYLASAKSQIRFKFHKTREEGLDIASSLVLHSLLNQNPSRVPYLDSIETTVTTDLRRVAGKYFAGGRSVFVSIVPQGKKKKR